MQRFRWDHTDYNLISSYAVQYEHYTDCLPDWMVGFVCVQRQEQERATAGVDG